ncbi:hypothetical protein OROHE_007001 [Orobanche hederae]
MDRFDVPSKVLQKKRVARILVFKIRPSQEILKIHVPSKVLQKKRVARIMVFKIRPSQEINKIRDGTPFGGGKKFDIHKKALEMDRKKRVARILIFKIRPSQEILKIPDGTPLEAEEILTYKKSPRNESVWYFSSKLDVRSKVLQKKRVAWILVFKIRPSQEILKIRDGTPLEMSSQEIHKIRDGTLLEKFSKIPDGTPLEAEEILTYKKSPRNESVWYFSSKLDVPSKVLQKKRVARILVFKIRPSQEILKIHVPSKVLQKKRVARIMVFKIRPSQEINKIRDGTHFGGGKKFDIHKKALEMDRKKRVARILIFKIRPSQEILKIPDGTPLEAEEILTYKKSPRNESVWYFSSKLDVRSKVLQKKRVAWILVFKIRPSQEILKIRDGTPLEMSSQEIHKIRDGTLLEKFSKIPDGTPLELDVPSKVLQKKRVARILVFKIRPSQEILKIHVPSKVLQKKRVARIMVFKIRPSQEINKIRDGTHFGGGKKFDIHKKALEMDRKKRVARILIFKIRPSQEILKIPDGTPLEAEEILTYKKSPRNESVWYFSSKLDVRSKVLQKKRVAWILVFKIRPSQEILKIRDGTPLEKRVVRILVFKIRSSQEIHKIRDGTLLEKIHKIRDGTPLEKKRVARILIFKIRPSQEILKIPDGTPLEAEEILTYKKSPRNESVWYFSSKLDVRSKVLQKKRVAWILVFKIRPSQEILKIRDGTPLEMSSQEIHKIRDEPSQEIHKIRDGTPLELDVPSKVLQKKRVARILVFKIRPSQEIHKIRDGTPFGGGKKFDIHKKALEMDR